MISGAPGKQPCNLQLRERAQQTEIMDIRIRNLFYIGSKVPFKLIALGILVIDKGILHRRLVGAAAGRKNDYLQHQRKQHHAQRH